MRIMKKNATNPKDDFSVALGLTDYGNPICYTITSVVIAMNLNKIMPAPYSWIYLLGVIVSLVFGFAIPTVKILVGMGKMKFSLPTGLVFYVNAGLMVSGLMLFKNMIPVSLPVLACVTAASVLFLYAMYKKVGKFNPIAIMTGAVVYLFIYSSLITQSVRTANWLALVFYGIAVACYLFLIGLGLKADLMDARVHWILELTNICCQASVAVGTVLLFM